MQSFSLYLLAALGRGNLAKEASLKYFLYGSFLSSMLLLGLSLIY
jgi:NADH:ubiquinone oxidoreductase subunit 2 (subunit N)